MNPWMSFEEVALAEQYLSQEKRMLEWGSGGSTARFAPKVMQLVSIEHDAEWAFRMRGEAPSANIIHVPQNFPMDPVKDASREYPPRYRRAFLDYILAPRQFGTFDVILIDGRARLFCAIEAAERLLNPGGVIMIHDFHERPRYWPILQWCRVEVEISRGQGLVVLRHENDHCRQ